jgi:cytochrome c-type biogenesis protein CcmH
MILFWLICAGLIAIALAFILPTLLQRDSAASESNNAEANLEVYRDQLSELDADLANGLVSPEQYQQDRDEIERRLLEDVPTAESRAAKPALNVSLKPLAMSLIAIGIGSFIVPHFGLQVQILKPLPGTQPGLSVVLITLGALILAARSSRSTTYALALALPIMAVSIYLTVGNLRAFEPITAARTPDGQMTQQGIEANVEALRKRLEEHPDDAAGWAMLGRSYVNLEKYTEAGNAYGKAVELKKDDANLLTEYAFALAMANGRQLQGKPAELIKQALQIAPENPQVLQLAGTAEFEAKNYKQAIVYWQKLLEKSAGNPDLEQAISKRIDEAKKLAGVSANQGQR